MLGGTTPLAWLHCALARPPPPPPTLPPPPLHPPSTHPPPTHPPLPPSLPPGQAVFLLIGKTSALTMNIAGVIKDWSLIFFSWYVFQAPVTK